MMATIKRSEAVEAGSGEEMEEVSGHGWMFPSFFFCFFTFFCRPVLTAFATGSASVHRHLLQC